MKLASVLQAKCILAHKGASITRQVIEINQNGSKAVGGDRLADT